IGTLLLIGALAAIAPAFAQGVQTGTVRGAVRDTQGLPMPGVTVTATSAALQGPRTTVTSAEGEFTLAALPPGNYTITFELSGFGTATRQTDIPVGSTINEAVTLAPAGVSETVRVVAETPAPIATPAVTGDFKHTEIEALATPRTIQGIA